MQPEPDTARLRILHAEGARLSLADAAAERPSPEAVSLGQLLQAARVARCMTLQDLAQHTRIPKRSLEAMEADRFSDLPGDVFAKGFLRCYARVLDLDAAALVVRFETEQNAVANPVAHRAEEALDPAAAPSATRAAVPEVDGRAWWRLLNLPGASQVRLGQQLGRLTPTAFLWLVMMMLGAIFVLVAFQVMRSAGPSAQV